MLKLFTNVVLYLLDTIFTMCLLSMKFNNIKMEVPFQDDVESFALRLWCHSGMHINSLHTFGSYIRLHTSTHLIFFLILPPLVR